MQIPNVKYIGFTCSIKPNALLIKLFVLFSTDAAVITSSTTNIQLLEPLVLTCSVDPSVITSGTVSYQWTTGCDSDCSWSGVMTATLSTPYIRGRDYGDYTCTITEGSTVIGRSVFSIDHIEGEQCAVTLL